MPIAFRADSIVSLPGGLLLPDNRRLDEVELRPLSGREEDWLASHPEAPRAVAISRVLAGCVVRLGGRKPSGDLLSRLLVGDRDFLILQLRRLTLGDRFDAVMQCPACYAKMDVAFYTSDVHIDSRPQTALTYSIDLPADGRGPARSVAFRLPNGADQEAIKGLAPGAAVAELLRRCVIDDCARPLTPVEADAVSVAMERVAPQIDLQLDLVCPECSHVFTAPFDTTAFFLDELRIHARKLLREVHLLAFYYHWSEAQILALRRSRRRAYLDLLCEPDQTRSAALSTV
jgi:hypothetical protein